MRKRHIILLILVVLIASCSKRVTTTRVTESFDVFYDRFHEDWSFQQDRVKFPLEGKYTGPEGEKDWSRDDWELHRQKVTDISDPGFDTEILRQEEVVIEKVQEREAGFYVERRFRLIDGKWYLVYYETVNL